MPQTHLDTFWNCFPIPPHQGAVGEVPNDYLIKLNALCGRNYSWPKGYPVGQLTRPQLRVMCLDPTIDVLIAYAAVMAWGGRGVESRNYRLSLSPASLPCLIKILTEIRGSIGKRKSDFTDMQWAAKHIKGLGISFYTKLLFFFRKRPNAYILDQFTAKSAKLLFDPCKVVLNSSGYPDPGNTPDAYEWFCSSVEKLGHRRTPPPTWSGEQVEQAMFDVRGGNWRKYLRCFYGSTGSRKSKNPKLASTTTPSTTTSSILPPTAVGGLPARVTRTHAAYYRAGCDLPGAYPKVGIAQPIRVHCSHIDGVDWQYAFQKNLIHAQVFIPSKHIDRYDALRSFLGVAEHNFGDQIDGTGGKGGKTRSLKLTVSRGLSAPQNKWDEIAREVVFAMHTLYNRVCEIL